MLEAYDWVVIPGTLTFSCLGQADRETSGENGLDLGEGCRIEIDVGGGSHASANSAVV